METRLFYVYGSQAACSIRDAGTLGGFVDIVGLHDMGQMASFVGFADTAGNGTVFAQGISEDEAGHTDNGLCHLRAVRKRGTHGFF